MRNKFIIGAACAAIILGGAVAAGATTKNNFPTSNMEKASNNQEIISSSKAVNIALSKADGYVESVDLEKKNGKRFYEIDIEKEDIESEIKVDAVTGEILSIKEKRFDNNDDWDEREDVTTSATTKYITTQEAIKIAEKEVNGKVREIDRDHDDGQVIYEIELETSKGKVELDLDAITGKVLKVEYED